MNVQFADAFKNQLIKSSFESVMIVQEACYRLCNQAGIHQTQVEMKMVGEEVDAASVVKDVVDAQKARYLGFLTLFADGFQTTALAMYKWILYPVLKSSMHDLEQGLRLTDLSRIIKQRHPEGQSLNNGNLTQSLSYAAGLQVTKDVRPIILDYDQTNRRLNVVDRGFLIWLSHQNINELLELVDLPTT